MSIREGLKVHGPTKKKKTYIILGSNEYFKELKKIDKQYAMLNSEMNILNGIYVSWL